MGESLKERMNEWMRKILESKRTTRHRLSNLSFTDKIFLLEKLRDRSLAIARRSLKHEVAPSNKPQ
jgi:hypothetical protein